MKEFPELTKQQSLVYETLLQEKAPVGAYALLDRLREHGLRGPQQIYRALDKLTELKLVHRLDSLSAFVACQHKDDDDHSQTTAFMICSQCGKVEEMTSAAFAGELLKLAETAGFTVRKASVELTGICKSCHAKPEKVADEQE